MVGDPLHDIIGIGGITIYDLRRSWIITGDNFKSASVQINLVHSYVYIGNALHIVVIVHYLDLLGSYAGHNGDGY